MPEFSQQASVSVVMTGPLPPAVGGMASVLSAFEHSSLPSKVKLSFFQTGKTTPEGRSLWQGIQTRIKLMLDWRQTVRTAGKGSIAHIHTCSGLTFFLDGLLLLTARRAGVIGILHVHGGRFDVFLDSLASFPRQLASRIIGMADDVIVLSDEWKTKLEARFPGVAFSILANGVPVFPASAIQAKSSDRPVFLFLGNLSTLKGVQVLLGAVCKAKVDWQIILAGNEGEPGYESHVRREIERLAITDRVVVAGSVIGKDKEALLGKVDGFVLPSLAEGLPMSLLEAMAAHLPVVVTTVGAIPGVVREGREGYLVSPGDEDALALALDRLAFSPEDRRRMGDNAAKTCETGYGVEQMVDGLLEIYHRQLQRVN